MIYLLREAFPALRQQDRNILWIGSRHPVVDQGIEALVLVFKVRSVLRVPKRGVVDVKLVSFPCPVEIGVVRRPPSPIETDFRMCFHFTLPEHLLSPALPFPLVTRHQLSCEEAHDIVIVDLPLQRFDGCRRFFGGGILGGR